MHYYASFVALCVTCLVTFSIAATKLREEPVQNIDAPIVPWLQPSAWKPEYDGLENDLAALVKMRAVDSWVSLFCFSLPAKPTDHAEEASLLRLALNTLYSYRVFGQLRRDIVAALSPRALAVCKQFRLPCYDATSYSKDHSYANIGWAKVKLSRDILKMGVSLHLSDLDISYVKPLEPAMQEIFSRTNDAADGSMMEETWVHQDNPSNIATRRTIYLGNLGVVFLKSNNRNVNFLDALLKWASAENQDQYMLTLVAYQAWAPCSDEAACLAIRARGMAAITLHPTQFAGSNCVPEHHYSLCGWRRLYVHAVCRATARDKEAFMRHLKAMFIAPSSVGGGGGGGDGGATSGTDGGVADPAAFGLQDNAAIAASGLPCPVAQQRAWREPSRAPRRVDGGGGGGGSGSDDRALLMLRGGA